MSSVRLSRLIFLLIFLVVILLNYHYISKNLSDDPIVSNILRPARSLLDKPFDSHLTYNDGDLDEVSRIENLRFRIKEMFRIRGSVSNELKNLESKRQKLQDEISNLVNQLGEVKYQLSRKQSDLSRLHLSVAQAEVAQREVTLVNQPFIARPIKLLPLSRPEPTSKENLTENILSNICTMSTCFDYSRCSLTSGFPTYIYPSIINPKGNNNQEPTPTRQSTNHPGEEILSLIKHNPHYTSDGNIACIYIVLISIDGPSTSINDGHTINSTISTIQSSLHNLDYWSGDGRNHLIINLSPSVDIIDQGIKPCRALVVQSKFSKHHWRENFDLIIPPIIVNSDHDQFPTLSSTPVPNCPARRKHLLTYGGFLHESAASVDLSTRKLIQTLKRIADASRSSEEIFFNFNCANDKCLTDLLSESTFSLVLTSQTWPFSSDPQLISQLFQLLRLGVIPILIVHDDYRLPFHESIDWKRVIIPLPLSRISEIHFIVKSFSDSDIIQMKLQGKLIFDRYFSSTAAKVNTLISFVRQQRLNIPALPAQETTYPNLYNKSFSLNRDPETSDNSINQEADFDENLGPIEPPFPSLTFQRNFSLTLCHGYQLWNSPHYSPFTLYPSTPFDPVLPSEAKFIGSGYGFRPINQGAGGSGKEFVEALGGNWPKEQFTIVILTYEREAILLDSLQRLKGCPYLNKVLVIWNSPRKPLPDIKWPDLEVPINVIEAEENSLNNRFKPYVQIETEAILSMDDDVHLRHDEIVFGFRVWREARDRIVGFPGRYHAWDSNFNSWLYNSNYTCEFSMVLTGAAFFHKYYTYLYTYTMDSAIRDKVNEFMNCEDIAMNFLVSHITRQPPVKVTSRWTFRCPGCPARLSEDDSHFQERHKCINYFTSLYGYNPLLQTQFRVDSILFKTRIPHDKQKCFKYL